MIDKDGNVIPKSNFLIKFWWFIKDNTPQIAIIIPIGAAIYTVVSNYFCYLANLGYYKYFGIDKNLMLPYNKNNFYESIGEFALVGLYWVFALFAVRMILIKGNYLWKFFSCIVIPLLINCALAFDGEVNVGLIIASLILIPLQWGMIFALGYCMAVTWHNESLDRPKKIRTKKKRGQRWGDKEFLLLGILGVFLACVVFFWQQYSENNNMASKKKRFGIVEIDQEPYAVIDANENKIILQRCEINNNNLKLYSNTYLCAPNEMLIKFENVELVRE